MSNLDQISTGAPLDLSAALLRVSPAVDVDALDEGSADTDIDRVQLPTETAHAEAIGNPVDINPTDDRKGQGSMTPLVDTPPQCSQVDVECPHDLIEGGPELLRDRVALLEIARFRLLSFQDLNTGVFRNRDKAVVTRRMQALARDGFINVWEQRLVIGGHPRYAIPTRKGLTWALAELEAEARGRPHEKLVQFMRGEAPRPLLLEERTAPPFLPHQLETNRVVAALEAIPALGIIWASTWHRPFPNQLDHIEMPHPDAVLVATLNGTPHLVFLEHDRGQESPASFHRKKVERYYEFSMHGLSRELFGIDAFTVWVSVNDVADRKPLQRIRVLQRVSMQARMMRFTLAGWIPGHGHSLPIWFAPSHQITAQENTPLSHEGLAGPFSSDHDAATTDPGADLLRRLRRSRKPPSLDDDVSSA